MCNYFILQSQNCLRVNPLLDLLVSHDKVQGMVYVTMCEFIDKDNISVGIYRPCGLLVN